MNFNEDDLDFFMNNIYNEKLYFNSGCMSSVDMFTLHLALKNLKPKIVIESGVWQGTSTYIIRKTLGQDVIIFCLDPLELPTSSWRDLNSNTKYFIGNNFVDFNNLDLNMYNSRDIFAFFDDHQNAISRILQCHNKNIKNILFNDNYPKNCGSHFTIEHLINNDFRNIKNKNANDILNINDIDMRLLDKNIQEKSIEYNYVENKEKIINLFNDYYIFPNIFPGEIKTGEGYFPCKSYFMNNEKSYKYKTFFEHQLKYRWNTLLILN
jgi:hypothetical protein